MGILRLQHAMHDDDGLPEDMYVNTFYFITAGSPTENDSNGAAGLISAFFQTAVDGTVTPASKLSTQLSGVVTMKTYNMADALPRTPIAEYTDVYSVGSGSAPNLPPEVAVCLSFNAAPVAGIPPARLRGRVYIGPLDWDAAASGPDNHTVVDPAFMNALTKGAENMQTAAGLLNLKWAVYSPTRGAANEIVRCHVDNAFDTQRRRGNDATSRNTVIF